MNITRSLVLALSLAAAACASNTDDVASASAGDTAACPSMQKYDAAVDGAKTTLQTSYDAAMTQFNADVKQAGVDRDAKLAALPNGDDTSDLYNQAIVDYNAEVGPKGPIVAKYDLAVKTAQDVFNATVKTALDAYNAKPCYE